MSLFKMPKAVIERLDCMRRDFLWDGQADKKKLHLIKWSEVIKPKSNGGLGIGSLENKNLALLAKWWWRFREEKEALWRKLITSTFVEDKWGWWPKQGPNSCRSGIWKAIAAFRDEPNVKGQALYKGVDSVVANGRNVRVWLDD